MAPQPKVLVVLSSHDTLGATGKKTGWYLPEFAHPYKVLAPHTEIVVASPAGGAAPLDPSSVEASKDDSTSTDFLANSSALWSSTSTLASHLGHAADFAALFFVGGHGPMFDLATDATSHALINEFHAAQKPIAAVCHGPAALAHVKLTAGPDKGKFLVQGQRVTGFSNAEEDAVQLSSFMPFMLEDALDAASGGAFEKAAEPWAEKVVVARDGKLITGQNPASATGVGKAIYDAIFQGGAGKKDEI